jgi:formate hydrogenlyase subunit 3/multisubunit Na+/H+ antiporter MnhD subunit
MMGIPLMSGFVSKWMLYAAALQAGWAVPAMVAWAVSLGTVFLCAKATSAVFLGPLTEATKDAHEAPPTMVWGMGLMAAGSIVLGIAPQLAVNYFLNPILAALGLGAGVQMTWFGLFSSAGSFSTTGGLVLALVSLVLGGAIYIIAYVARSATVTATAGGVPAMAGAGGGIFTGGEPLGSQGRLTAGDFSDIFLQNWHEFFRWSNVDAVYLGVWGGLQAVSRVLGVVVSWMERRALALVIVLTAAVFALIHFAGLIAPADVGFFAIVPISPLLTTAIEMAALGLLFASFVAGSKGRIPLWPFIAVVSCLSIGGLVVDYFPTLRLVLLEASAFLTVVLVWLLAKNKQAKYIYLTVVLVSAICAIGSEVLSGDIAVALLVTGIVVKLAAIPMLFWLLSLADELPALVLGLIVSVVDMAAFGEFFIRAQKTQIFFVHQPLLVWIAALTSFSAALLMLSQKSLKRLLVLSTIEDAGFLLLGVSYYSVLGIIGAIFAAATHALAKALLFICLSGPEADSALDGEPKALAVRYPVSAFGFLFGMLAMLGIPPMLGYLGRWRLYETALQISPILLAVFILSSVFALIAYVLALTRVWWGPASNPDPPPSDPTPLNSPHPIIREPLLLQATIVVLAGLLLLAGVWPNALQMLQGGRP